MDQNSITRAWSASYPDGLPQDITPEHQTPLTMLAQNVATRPGEPAIHYFDGTMSWADVDRAADALAALLIARAFRPGDRLALILQNNPAFVIGLYAAWKVGGVAVLLSPMSKERELRDQLKDSEPAAMLVLDDIYVDVARAVLATEEHNVHTVITVSPRSGQSVSDVRLFPQPSGSRPGDTLDLDAVIATDLAPHERRPDPLSAELAVLAYTSGTTGTPKAAMLSHGNMAFNAQTYRDWTGLTAVDSILALAPVFHVSGLIGGVLLALALGSPIIMTHRFEASVMVETIRDKRPAFAIATITAYLGLADDGHATPADLTSIKCLSSGGAPVEPQVADRLELALGHYIHNIYGQTETTSPSHAVPIGVRAPVDEITGTLSIGLPVFNTNCRIVDDDGADLPVGEIGELVTSGPQVASGYWRDPVTTAARFNDGELRTGDVGFMDEAGWFYVLDRRVDLINAAGFKVSPREVEQVLMTHPGVREAAVVSMPDQYRGESVRAFVSPEEGADLSEIDLIEFCRSRLAAFKYPREIELVAELPRTLTGKVSRNQLRDR